MGDVDGLMYIINADGSNLTPLSSGGLSASFSPMRVDGVLYDTYGHII